jgi:O-antigen/teichoic acid export membrane protein
LKKILYQGIFWRGLNYLTVFVVSVVVARIFQADGSGRINYTLNNLALVILVASISLESGTAYYSAKGDTPRSELIGISLLAGAICMIIAWPASRWLLGIENIRSLAGCVLYCGGVVFCSYFNALYYSQNLYIFPNLTTAVVNLGIVVLCMVYRPLFMSSGNSLFLLVYGSAFFLTGCVLAAQYLARHQWQVNWPSNQTVKSVLSFAVLALITNLIYFLVYRVDYWFVRNNATASDLGNYIQVSKIGQIFLLMPGVIGTILFTRTASKQSEDVMRELQILSRLLLLAYTLVVTVLLISGQWLFPYIYGQSFGQMYWAFVLLSPGILSLSTLTLVAAYNAGRGKMIVNLRGAVIALLVIVAGNSIFSASYGIYAAAAVSSLGYITYQVYIMAMIKRGMPGVSIKLFFLPQQGDIKRIKSFFLRNEKQ